MVERTLRSGAAAELLWRMRRSWQRFSQLRGRRQIAASRDG